MEPIERRFVALNSPTADRSDVGYHPCQGIYHLRAGSKPKTAAIATHYNADFSEHYLGEYFAERGYGFLGWNTRFRGGRGLLYARACPDRHRRRRALVARGGGRRERGDHRELGWRIVDGRIPVPGCQAEPACAAGHAATGSGQRAS